MVSPSIFISSVFNAQIEILSPLLYEYPSSLSNEDANPDSVPLIAISLLTKLVTPSIILILKAAPEYPFIAWSCNNLLISILLFTESIVILNNSLLVPLE